MLVKASNDERYADQVQPAMIHHNRTKRPIIRDTYGLVTNGLKWTFLHVNKEHEGCVALIKSSEKLTFIRNSILP